MELKYTPPAQIAPCPFLEVREFELRPPDADDWEEENPTFPNALPVCTSGQPCRYATYCCPQPWHTWDTQTICCGFIVAYAGGDTIELRLTVEPEVGVWWPHVAPLQIQPEATRDEQLALISAILITPALREEFPKNVKKWSYAGAVAYLGRQLIGAHTPQHIWHWPEARVGRGGVAFWYVGRNSPAAPDEIISIGEFIQHVLPEPPPEAEQLALF